MCELIVGGTDNSVHEVAPKRQFGREPRESSLAEWRDDGGQRPICAPGDASIAYRVLGERGPYLAIVLGPFPGLLLAEHPAARASVERASRFARPVVFDVQGSGRSDPLPPGVAASVEHEAEQLIAVLAAAGIGTAYVLGTDTGGAVAVSVAVQRPDLVSGLVLANAYARALRDDDYPWGLDRRTFDRFMRELPDRHGTGFLLDLAAPSVANDPEVREFWIECEQQMASPAQAAAITRIAETVDVRGLLPQVQAPTLVIHSVDNTLYPIEHGRYLAEHIPNARFVEFAGRDHIFLWESDELFRDEIEAFVTGTRPSDEPETCLGCGAVHRPRRVHRACSHVRRPSLAQGVRRILSASPLTRSNVFGVAWSSTPATECSQPLDQRPTPSAARSRSYRSSSVSVSICIPESTSGTSSAAATTSGVRR